MADERAKAAPIWNVAPLAVLRLAVRQVPSMRYALGVGGIAAIVAIVLTGWKLPPQKAVIGTLIVFVAMVVLVIFAALSKESTPGLRPLALSMAWSFLAITVATAALFVSCAFFSRPKSLECLMDGKCGDGTDGGLSPSRGVATAIVDRATSILDDMYAQRFEKVYSQLSPALQQSLPFAQFRAIARRQLPQLESGPLKRTLSAPPKPEAGFLFVRFDSEFDERSRWLEGVTFIETPAGWALYRLDMQPASWSNATGTSKLLTDSDPQAVIRNRGNAAVDYWLPQQGWRSTVHRILAKRGERTCDVELLSGNVTVNARNLLGGCTLKPGRNIDLVGRIIAVGTASIDIEEGRFHVTDL
jgi:hypothetical protein